MGGDCFKPGTVAMFACRVLVALYPSTQSALKAVFPLREVHLACRVILDPFSIDVRVGSLAG